MLLLAALAASAASARAAPAAATAAGVPRDADPLRLVFLVHGWNGSLESFGILPRLLASAQPDLWPAGHWTVVPVVYRSPRPDATIAEQAAACGHQILEAVSRLEAANPGRHREVYFVTHSMGGLIVRQLWLDHHGRGGDGLPAPRGARSGLRPQTSRSALTGGWGPPAAGLPALLDDVRAAVLVAPPNHGSDEVRFAIQELERGIGGLAADLLSERALKSLTNGAVRHFLNGIPVEQARNMAAGSDYIEALNGAWQRSGACDRFPAWVLAGEHDVVVDLANANLDWLQVGPGPDGRIACARCAVDRARVRYYPYNHSNTNRRDGILGSIQGPDHPVFADLARILLGRELPAVRPAVGPSKIFLRFLHPANDRITDVVVDPFEGAIRTARAYEMNLSAGAVVGFRERGFVVLAGLPSALQPVSGATVLILKVKGLRRRMLPALLPYVPRWLPFEHDYGPEPLVRERKVTYRPIQVSLPPGTLTTNSVLSLTVQLSEAPAAVPEAVSLLSGACPTGAPDAPGSRRAAAEEALRDKDSLDVARQLRKLGATQDEAILPVLERRTAASLPPPLRRAALAAAGDLRVPQALPVVERALGSPDATIRAIALDALGRVPSVRAARELIRRLARPGTDRGDERAALAGLCQVPEPIFTEALSRELAAPGLAAGTRSRIAALSLASGRATRGLIAVVARQALAAAPDSRTAPDHYGRILDALVEHATPDERTWLRRARREAGQARDSTWTRALLAGLVRRTKVIPASRSASPASSSSPASATSPAAR
jgi:hypothetical protein